MDYFAVTSIIFHYKEKYNIKTINKNKERNDTIIQMYFDYKKPINEIYNVLNITKAVVDGVIRRYRNNNIKIQGVKMINGKN